ncbi:formate dehydrogenase subunit gamma [Candidatus Desulfobacillus denitrificans]|uniref:Formate dehydrogenase subunit gamma n=1 Tax=Candidatus Desulfobacillus denitrificans TaxID=2608985 RepID=A0A809R583_9PROT|nr:formate dehydrogenase subunit gamma [Candidatus Desulfobacillus denitrificans]
MDASLNAELSALLDAHRDRPGALLPVLHAVQDALGHIPPAAVPIIARALNLSRAEVHGVIGFYRHFRSRAPGRHVVQVCRAEACQAVGALELEAHARRALGCGFHATCADGSVTLEPVYCLGNCACGPSVRVDDEIVGRVDARRFDELLAELRDAP